jgi:outer membrane protein assembly factor BamE (lipoprotein component of BamABCDE complex)
MRRAREPNLRARPRAAGRQVHGTRPGLRSTLAAAVLVFGTVWLAACATTITKHGQQFTESDISQVQQGMSPEQVRMALGSPTTTAVVGGGNAFYYISSTVKEEVFSKPHEVDRTILAVYFTPTSRVDRVAQYGLKDGKVFDFISRKTPTANTAEDGIFKALFRNLGHKQIFGD